MAIAVPAPATIRGDTAIAAGAGSIAPAILALVGNLFRRHSRRIAAAKPGAMTPDVMTSDAE